MRATINGDVVYKFTGQEYDEEFGLYNFRARLYDDELGIFYAVDPGGQNFSPFSYAGNNPIIYIDKDGKFFWLPLAILAAAGTYGAVKGAIEGGRQGAIYGFGSMTTAAGFAMASIGASVASGGSLGLALMNAGFHSMWATTQGGNFVETAAVTFASSYIAANGLWIADKIGGGLAGKLLTQTSLTTLNSIGSNWLNDRPLFENLKVGVGPLTLNVNGSKFLDINLKDNIVPAIGHTLGFANVLTGGDVDYSWENLSFRFSGGWYEKYVIRNTFKGTNANSLFDVAWTKEKAGETIFTNDTYESREEFLHIWQSRFFSGMQNFWVPYLGSIGVEYFINNRSLEQAYKNSFFELQAGYYLKR